MLISAFLLAMMVVAITLMLNNVIYSSNMAYVGFMDQSRYDDLSYKQATIKEAIYADASDHSQYANHMNDYKRSLNNIISMRGRYVDLTPQALSGPGPMDITNTMTWLSIYGKGSNTSYIIYTGANNTVVAPPVPPPAPTHYLISLSANKTSMYNDSVDRVKITATVTDADNPTNPVSNFFINISTDRGVQPDAYTIDEGGYSSQQYHVIDPSGTKVVYYVDRCPAGTAHISANIGTDTSNTLSITVTAPPPPPGCPHNVTVSSATIDRKNNNDHKITVTLNLGPISNIAINPTVVSYTPSSVTYDNSIMYDNSTKQLTMTVQPNDNDQFTIELRLAITGDCTLDNLSYSRNATLTLTGTKIASTPAQYAISYDPLT